MQNTTAGADSGMNGMTHELPGSLASDPHVRNVRLVCYGLSRRVKRGMIRSTITISRRLCDVLIDLHR
jgi:hypothetical protein